MERISAYTPIKNELPELQARFGNRKPMESELKSIVPNILGRNNRLGWSFRWNNRKVALGVCRYKTKTIELSRLFYSTCNNEQIFDTLLHEIAHAIAGPKAKHGPIWKSVARQIGASPTRCADVSEIETPKGRYGAKYSDDGDVIDYRYRRTKGMETGKFTYKGKRVFWYDLYTGKRITKLSRESVAV